jgi:NAD(P)H-quinone oxidoreductase subunit 5
MLSFSVLWWVSAVMPMVLMLAAIPRQRGDASVRRAWRRLQGLAGAALVFAGLNLVLRLFADPAAPRGLPPLLDLTVAAAWIAVLVQLLGVTIASFSARYLEGEPGQPRYVAALSVVLAAVHLLLLADHWLVLIAAWAVVGLALQHLLCFYTDRPFALLAAHKKRVADRLADLLLIVAAALSWHAVGSGSLSALRDALAAGPAPWSLQLGAVCLALAVVLRTALLPVHGWLIQVMEAPTPVSALLHAGVVNLGGFVLIRFAPLLEASPAARWLLVGAGTLSAVLAGFVMLTRISIKVRLAWSTVAQMGFMVMECGLGLYSLALLHLIGHSLYKAHTFLAASSVVEDTRLRVMRGSVAPSLASVILAPVAAGAILWAVLAVVRALVPGAGWPAWWSAVMALAWAPLLWLPAWRQAEAPGWPREALTGAIMVSGLVLAACVGHALPLGVADAPHTAGGLVALAGMAWLYLGMTLMQTRARAVADWRRWSYAGFYADEFITRATLRLWPTRWTAPITK